jgi:peptide/nickel transport system substrate-binding protein
MKVGEMTFKRMTIPRQWRAFVAVAMMLAVALPVSLVGQASVRAGAASVQRGSLLTVDVATGFTPESLNPALANTGTDNWFTNPLWGSLIQQDQNGGFSPDLATKWGYVGTNNETFDLTLRSGLKFSNGQPLTAESVAKSIKYIATLPTAHSGPWIKMCSDVRATGALSVQIKCSSPNTQLPLLLSATLMVGDIIAPASLAHPSTIASNPIGAGEYVLDRAATTIGSTYVYTANPFYWNQSAIHYKKMIVDYEASAASALANLQDGSAQVVISLDAGVDATAHADGIAISTTSGAFFGINLIMRGSTKATGPTASLEVRQALEYAVDRGAIAQAEWGDYGVASDIAGISAFPNAYPPADQNYYPYNVAKAKSLLAAAGYPNGFTINMETFVAPPFAEDATAVCGYWAAINVTCNTTTDNEPNDPDVENGTFAAAAYAYGGLPLPLEAANWFEPEVNAFNPLGSSNASMATLLKEAGNTSGAKQVALYQKVAGLGVTQAWFINVLEGESAQFTSSSVTGGALTRTFLGNQDFIRPAN